MVEEALGNFNFVLQQEEALIDLSQQKPVHENGVEDKGNRKREVSRPRRVTPYLELEWVSSNAPEVFSLIESIIGFHIETTMIVIKQKVMNT